MGTECNYRESMSCHGMANSPSQTRTVNTVREPYKSQNMGSKSIHLIEYLITL